MKNDHTTSSDLLAACVKSNEIKRVECLKTCVKQMCLTEFHFRQ